MGRMTLPVDMLPKVIRALTLIGEGKTETHACDDADISVQSFRKYVNASADLADLYAEAAARGYDAMADKLVRIDEWGIEEGVTDPKMLALISKNVQWYLNKRRPQVYGDKSEVVHSITADRAIIEALSQGKQRALEGKVIEATYTVVQEAVRVHGVDMDPELLEFVG